MTPLEIKRAQVVCNLPMFFPRFEDEEDFLIEWDGIIDQIVAEFMEWA